MSDKPSIRIVPPQLAGMFLLLGIAASFAAPLRLFDFWPAFFMGLFLLPIGGGLIVWAIRTFAEHNTNVRIDRPATVVVTSGPYAFTRNPIYLGGAIAYTSIALLFNAGWAIILLLPLLIIIQQKVIFPEETYLETKFGAPYIAYREKVKRWF